MEVEQNINRVQKRGNDGKFIYDIDMPQNEVFACMTQATDGVSNLLYSVPTGKRFRVRTMIIYNPTSVDNDFFVRDGSAASMVFPVLVPAGDETVIDMIGPFFSSSVNLSAATYVTATPCYITIGGILDPIL